MAEEREVNKNARVIEESLIENLVGGSVRVVETGFLDSGRIWAEEKELSGWCARVVKMGVMEALLILLWPKRMILERM